MQALQERLDAAEIRELAAMFEASMWRDHAEALLLDLSALVDAANAAAKAQAAYSALRGRAGTLLEEHFALQNQLRGVKARLAGADEQFQSTRAALVARCVERDAARAELDAARAELDEARGAARRARVRAADAEDELAARPVVTTRRR